MRATSGERRLSDQGGQEPEDFLLDRLNEAATGDAAVRQLRRRYDLLRSDYERLLDRLGDLEDRLDESAAQHPAAPALADALSRALAEPLLRLRDDYLSAVTGIQSVAAGLEGLATGLKGQHAAPPTPTNTAGTPIPARPTPEPGGAPAVHKMQIDVKGSGFGELLDFQERLSQIPGVSRVSISAIDNERATLVVELDRP